MAHQLIFTSLEKTLLGGSGYGVAAQTPHFPKVLAEELSKLAGYVEIYPTRDANRQWNPVNYFYVKVSHWYVLGRLSSAENDYSGRFNFLGQFYCFESSELQNAGPAAFLQALPFQDAFTGPARMLNPLAIPTVSPPRTLICKQWADAAGDAGWGGAFAEKLKNEPSVWALYDRTLHGEKALALVAEAMALLDPADRWATTFSTHVEGFPKGNQVHLRMLQQGADQTRDFKAHAHCFDLTKANWPGPDRSSWVEMARTGVRPAHWNPPVVEMVHHAGHGEPSTTLAHGHAIPAVVVLPAEKGHSPSHASAKVVPPAFVPPTEGKKTKGKSLAAVPVLPAGPPQAAASGIPGWFYVAAAIGIFLAFGAGLATGTQMARSSLDESTAHGKDQQGQIQEQQKTIQELTVKNTALSTERDDLKKAAAQANEEKTAFKKYKDFLVGNGPNESKLLAKASEKDEENLKSAGESLKSLNENARLYLIHKERINRLADLERSYKLYAKIESIKKIIVDDPIIDEILRSGLNFDDRFKGLLNNKIKLRNELATKEGFINDNLKFLNDMADKKEYKMAGTKEDLFGNDALERFSPQLFTEKTGEFSIAGRDNSNYFKDKIHPDSEDQAVKNEKESLRKMLLSMSNTAATSSIILIENKISYPIVRFLVNQGEDIKIFGDKSFNTEGEKAVFGKLKTVIDKLVDFKNKK